MHTDLHRGPLTARLPADLCRSVRLCGPHLRKMEPPMHADKHRSVPAMQTAGALACSTLLHSAHLVAMRVSASISPPLRSIVHENGDPRAARLSRRCPHVSRGCPHLSHGGVHLSRGGVRTPPGFACTPTGFVHTPFGCAQLPTGFARVPLGFPRTPSGFVRTPSG